VSISWHAGKRMNQRCIPSHKVWAAIAFGKELPDIRGNPHIARFEHKGLRVIMDKERREIVTVYDGV